MPTPASLVTARAAIDAVDAQIVHLLAERATLALQIGQAKQAAGLPVYVPEREAAVLARVATLATGPLDAAMAARVFSAIVAETRALQTRQAR